MEMQMKAAFYVKFTTNPAIDSCDYHRVSVITYWSALYRHHNWVCEYFY